MRRQTRESCVQSHIVWTSRYCIRWTGARSSPPQPHRDNRELVRRFDLSERIPLRRRRYRGSGAVLARLRASAAAWDPAGQNQAMQDDLGLTTVHADKAYDARHCRQYLRRQGITARIARRGIESSQRLGRYRWRVERALSWVSCWRRLQVRWDRDAGRFFASVLLACALVCFDRLSGVRRYGSASVVVPRTPPT